MTNRVDFLKKRAEAVRAYQKFMDHMGPHEDRVLLALAASTLFDELGDLYPGDEHVSAIRAHRVRRALAKNADSYAGSPSHSELSALARELGERFKEWRIAEGLSEGLEEIEEVA